jgi:hypothetical protein
MIASMIEAARDTLEHLPPGSPDVARMQGRIQVLRQLQDPMPVLREWIARKESPP